MLPDGHYFWTIHGGWDFISLQILKFILICFYYLAQFVPQTTLSGLVYFLFQHHLLFIIECFFYRLFNGFYLPNGQDRL